MQTGPAMLPEAERPQIPGATTLRTSLGRLPTGPAGMIIGAGGAMLTAFLQSTIQLTVANDNRLPITGVLIPLEAILS